MNYLLTGGAGCIGSHLAEKIVLRGGQVTILDNFSTSSVKNLSQIKNMIKIVDGSILDKKLVAKEISSCDFVIHLAAALGVLKYNDYNM